MPGSKPWPVEPRLLAKVIKHPGGCWEWTGARTAPGWHGVIMVNHHRTVVHRVAYELWVGPIPAGLRVLHRCDNPPCVKTEPDAQYPDGHLFLGTQRDNMRDAAAKGRTGPQNRDWSHCQRGHEMTVDNVYIHPGHGRRLCRQCIRLRNHRHRVPELSRDAAERMDAALSRVLLTTSVDHGNGGLVQ